MKVLMVSPGEWAIPSSGGGTEIFVYHLTNELASLGCRVDLIADVDEAAYFHRNITIHNVNLPSLPLYNIGFWGYAFRHAVGAIFTSIRAHRLLKNDFDVVHAHGRFIPFLFPRFNKTPLIYAVNDDPPVKDSPHYLVFKTSYILLIQGMARKADCAVVSHDGNKDYLIKKGVPQEKITIIPNGGTDINTFKPQDKPRGNHCLFVGTLIRRKGIEYLLKAIAKLDNLSCLIVGDGPDKDYFLQTTNNLGITDRVRFTGAITDRDKLVQIYATSSFLVLPSLNEELGIVTLEAMACGTPAIVSNLPGPATTVQDGYNGFLVEPGDVESLTQKMNILHNSPQLRREMGERSLSIAREKFSWKSIAMRTLQLYRELAREEIR